MKSPMITAASYIGAAEVGKYSDLQVLRSSAGWYVGTTYNNPEGFTEPGSRDGGYFRTEDAAKAFLRALEAVDEAELAQLRRDP